MYTESLDNHYIHTYLQDYAILSAEDFEKQSCVEITEDCREDGAFVWIHPSRHREENQRTLNSSQKRCHRKTNRT